MDFGHVYPEPGAGPVRSDKEATFFLRRSLIEAEQKIELWKAQANEGHQEIVQCKSNVRVLQIELDALRTELKSTQEELLRKKDAYERQRGLTEELRGNQKAAIKAIRDYYIAKLNQELHARRGGGMLSCIGPIENELEKAHAKVDELTKKAEETEKAKYKYQYAYQQEYMKHHRTYNQAQALDIELNDAKKQIRVQDEELKAVRNELIAVKQQLGDAINLSEARGDELKATQAVLTKTDTLSVTDVAQKVNALNDEILQMAAFLGKMLVYEVLEPDADRQEIRQEAIKSTYQCAMDILGETLANALAMQSVSEPKEESNPLLVQIVMQIAVTNWCASYASRWTSYKSVDAEITGEAKDGQSKESGNKPTVSEQLDHDKFISKVYDSIRHHEDQAVAGRWRSLTRAHLPFSTNGWDHSLMMAIRSVMTVAGWATRSDDEMTQIEKRLGSIFELILALRKAMGEDVTSADLEISIIAHGQTFDPSYMEDAYADGGMASKSEKSVPERVICTSGLGLRRLVGKKSGEGKKQAEFLLMPRVVLEETVMALVPLPPTRKSVFYPDDGGSETGRDLLND
ncbi:hypothetical protein H1R20_g2037, partial [Candolleomyces eurysporus]